ncbi:MAG TPA: ABC transporter substrate-binding protein, partial [Chloroflexota bacterium]
WKEPYPTAGALQSLGSSSIIGLPPLPRHLLGQALEQSADALLNHSYWNQGYVGLGPYRLDRWEPGAFIEASAFEHHALGAPKIQRIKMLFLTDPSAALAAMLAGDTQLATDSALNASRAATLMRQLPEGRGVLVNYFNQWVSASFQGRPELASPPPLQDRRVRQALAHAVDRATINDAIFEGQNLVVDSIFAPTSELGRAADAAATRYPFDPARGAQLMTEAGFTKAPGAEFYLSPGGERLSLELRASVSDEALRTAMAGGWHQIGIDVRETFIPQSQVSDLQVKSNYPGLAIHASSGGENGVATMGSENIPRAENNWRGAGVAYNGYSNPNLDRLVAAFGVALEPADRNRAAADIVRLYSVELPALSLYFPPASWLFTSDLNGPKLRPASSNVAWNLYEWELH